MSVVSILLRLVLKIAVVGLLTAAAGAWLVAPPQPDKSVWVLRFALPVCAAALAWPLVRERWMTDLVPDQLHTVAPRYFDRDGISFALVPVADRGAGWLDVYFQNRYANAGRLRVVLRQPRRTLSLRRGPAPGVDLTIECDGGAFGVGRVEWPIPVVLQGQSARFEVSADAIFPVGRGRVLRRDTGVRVDAPSGDAARAAFVLAGAFLAGHIMSRATIELRLTAGVSEIASTGGAPAVKVLWQPDVATRGFPVMPAESPSRRG